MTTLFIVADVPLVETPAQDVRNALMILGLIEHEHPTWWALNPEFGRAARRATAAVKLLETPAHFPPTAHAAQHLRGAIEALTDVDVDWNVVPAIRVAVARLIRAVFTLERGA